MNKLKALLIGATVAASSSVAIAGASAGFDVVSAYIFRGGTVNDEVNVQPYLDGSVDEGPLAGLAVGTWANFNTDTEQFDEIDYYFSYSLPIEGPVSVDIGYTEYTFPTGTESTETSFGGATLTTVSALEADREISLSLGADLAEGLSAGFFAGFGLEGPFLDEGIYLEGSLGYETELSEGVSASAGASLGYEAGDNYAENGFSHAALTAGVGYEFVSVGLTYIVETDDDVLAVDEDFFASIGVGFDL